MDSEADLMARVTAKQRPANRLSHIAPKDAGPAIKTVNVGGQFGDISHQQRMSPDAVPGQPHNLPASAADGEALRSCYAPPIILADCLRRVFDRHFNRSENLFRFPKIGRDRFFSSDGAGCRKRESTNCNYQKAACFIGQKDSSPSLVQ